MQRFPFPLLALAFTACADSTAPPALDLEPAMAAVRLDQYNEREDWVMNLAYTCSAPSENVQVTGLLHTVSMMHLDGSGDDHWSFHSHPIQFQGVGETSGREFKVVGAENTTRTIETDGRRHFRQTAILRLMSPGEPAWTLKVQVDRERTPPGPWIYRIDRYDAECH